jgi:hypothetical protein
MTSDALEVQGEGGEPTFSCRFRDGSRREPRSEGGRSPRRWSTAGEPEPLPPPKRKPLQGSPVDASAYGGTAHYVATSVCARTTSPPQNQESECREQGRERPTPVKLASVAPSSSCAVAAVPGTALLVGPPAFAAVLVDFAALPNPTLIPCFHSFRPGLKGNEPMSSARGRFSKHHRQKPPGGAGP